MIKLILADDEPLVLVGLQNMLAWENHDVTLCGTARNGMELLSMIEQHQPDIVITDIKMPLASGLDAAKVSAERFGRFPLFIMLTNFEDFSYAREALSLRAVDYLVKIELTPQVLAASVDKAVEIAKRENDSSPRKSFSVSGRGGIHPFYDKFFIRLLNNLFENREQFELQKNELGLAMPGASHVVCFCTLGGMKVDTLDNASLAELNTTIVRMLKDTASRFLSCDVIPLDMKSIVVLAHLETKISTETLRTALSLMLQQTEQVIRNYFSVTLTYAIGVPVQDMYDIHHSFFTARRLSLRNSLAVAFPDALDEEAESPEAVFMHRDAIAKSIEELDTVSLDASITNLLHVMEERQLSFSEAMDAACAVLYMALTLLPDGQTVIDGIFSDSPDGYRSIYSCKNHEDIMKWLSNLAAGLSKDMASKRQDYRQMVVRNVQTYIHENISRKLSLGEVSALFGFSQNYLSHLFTKYVGTSFVEYVTRAKISTAKEMMVSSNDKIYAIAEKLGFENSFYFSKVFKKVEGISPRDYMNRTISQGEQHTP
ncbi:response regulator transcription factor [Parasphaerochaeta coccoides]|uniref:Two component transcriptional regulator, AraC family n=1 Tax=Parasphaerochaeta coccoides (strain ATCC BAA-1237 / DSM 17374 / SPN1) TaxID=760011 RepID=F4GLA7_PARC1|nr:AraC family transcriptional regulator [Parasphaerochaeta coccoides]AEC02939.1 two component transcriptional regulator, AraC family [Parasphaerochaeta coccoides DSM 17374]